MGTFVRPQADRCRSAGAAYPRRIKHLTLLEFLPDNATRDLLYLFLREARLFPLTQRLCEQTPHQRGCGDLFLLGFLTELRIEVSGDTEVQRNLQRDRALGRLGLGGFRLFLRYFGADGSMTSLAGRPDLTRGIGHVRSSLPSRESRRSAPRVFHAVTPEWSCGSTITVNTQPAVCEYPMSRV